MAVFQPPPTYADVIIVDPQSKQAKFNPIWLKWFLDLTGVINASGGGGGTVSHNSLAGLQGGGTGEFFHFTSAEHTSLEGIISNQNAGTVLSGPISGAAGAPSYKNRDYHKHKASNQSVTNSTVLVNDSDLLWSIGANETWLFRLHIHFLAAIKTTGIQLNLSVPAGASGHNDAFIVTDATSGNENYIVDGAVGSTLNIATGNLGGGAANGHVTLIGFVANGANAGTAQLQWAQSTASLTALTANQGSQVTANRVA